MIVEIVGDLFENLEGKQALMQCISSDSRMSRGISLEFIKHFPILKTLRQHKNILGTAVPVLVEGIWVYNLITKVNFFDKPRVETLARCLESVKEHATKMGVKILDTPMLGCGLDRLSYQRDLLPLVERIFRGSGVTINIYLQVKKDLFRYVSVISDLS